MTVSKINKEELKKGMDREMILSKVTNKFVLFQKIPLLIKRHVYSINVKAFSLIEMLVAMMVRTGSTNRSRLN